LISHVSFYLYTKIKLGILHHKRWLNEERQRQVVKEIQTESGTSRKLIIERMNERRVNRLETKKDLS